MSCKGEEHDGTCNQCAAKQTAPSENKCPECGLYAGDDSAPHWQCAAKASQRILDENTRLRAENAVLRKAAKWQPRKP